MCRASPPILSIDRPILAPAGRYQSAPSEEVHPDRHGAPHEAETTDGDHAPPATLRLNVRQCTLLSSCKGTALLRFVLLSGRDSKTCLLWKDVLLDAP